MSTNEQNDLLEKEQPKSSLRNRTGCSGADWGCGCFIVFMFLAVFAKIFPFFFPALFTSSGEHLPQAEYYSPEATDYSFHHTYLDQVHEFSIPENAFLEMCRVKKWQPIAIESLPDLPPFDFDAPFPRINWKREIPLTMPRYVYPKPEHEQCNPWSVIRECHIDPTGKTDQSCFHSVSQGYYFEHRRSNGGGIIVLYDTENGRCYINTNPH